MAAGETIRLSGRNLTENEHVKLGAYHTLEVEMHRPFQIYKTLWDALDLARIREACDPAASADLAAVLITVLTCRSLGSVAPFKRSHPFFMPLRVAHHPPM